MNSKTFLALLVVVCIIAVVSAQSTANPIASLQQKGSSIAASATNTSPAAPSNTNAAVALNSGSVYMQVFVLACAFVASSYLL